MLSHLLSAIYCQSTVVRQLRRSMSKDLILLRYTLSAICFFGVLRHATADGLFTFKIGNVDLLNIPFFPDVRLARSSDNDITTENVLTSGVDPDVIEDSFLKTPELVRKYGYPGETHHVTTDDGYILEMHRIARPGAKPVLLTHGLLDSSATFVLMGPNKGLAYLLYDQGYDVWMTNVRGNTYSRNHVKYTTKHAVFWDFTFHEMGKYDLPASIDYILNQTNYQKLHYIGHSQGTMTFWIMASERPEYMDKIMLMQALAPVAFIGHCKSPVVEFLSMFQDPLNILLRLIGAHEFLPNNEFITIFNQIMCDDTTITKEICSNVIFLTVGFDKTQFNETMLPVVVGHAPAGAATKQMQHFGQLKRSGQFRQFDYGWLRNQWRYNSVSPPNYKVENVKCKVALYSSKNDWLSVPQDVDRLQRLLPNVIDTYRVDYDEFNHLDFIWAIDARELLWNRMFKLMGSVEQNEARKQREQQKTE